MKLQTNTNRRVAISALLGGAALCAIGAGCVTINIYFPAAAAEKAADRIIDEVWQLKGGVPTPPATGAKPDAK
ncbi:MAG: hypothetical protein ABL891_20515 [Burkholderiales bacterium]